MYLQHWHGWWTAAILAQVLCTPYNHAPCHFMQHHIRKLYVCLAVTCHLHFWQNGQDLLRATAVTRGWNGYWNKSQHRESRPWRRKFSCCSCRDLNQRLFSHKSGALTTELSLIQFHSTDSILPMHKHCKSVTSLPVILVLAHKGLWHCKNCQHVWQCILLSHYFFKFILLAIYVTWVFFKVDMVKND